MISKTRWQLRSLRSNLGGCIATWLNRRAEWRQFWRSYRDYSKLAPAGKKPEFRFLFPCISDNTGQTEIEPIYFYQDAWAFEKIVNARPAEHFDVGSHHKFVALLSKVIPVTMVDIRPLSLPLDSLRFQKGSILDLPFEDQSIESLSSICVVEHIGLGRYGDPLDPLGTEKAMDELKRVIRPEGHLYLSMPLHNNNTVYFNAHRTFTEQYLRKMFQPFRLIESRYIYGNEFTDTLRTGFGTGCYHLQREA